MIIEAQIQVTLAKLDNTHPQSLFRRLRQDDHEFKASPGNISPCVFLFVFCLKRKENQEINFTNAFLISSTYSPVTGQSLACTDPESSPSPSLGFLCHATLSVSHGL